jgi:hypothetical protein
MASKYSRPILDHLSSYKLTYKQLANIVGLIQSNDLDDQTLLSVIISLITKKVSIKAVNTIYNKTKIQQIVNQPWLYRSQYILFSFDDVIIESSQLGYSLPLNANVPAVYKWYYTDSQNKARYTVNTSYPLSNIVGLHMAPLSVVGSDLISYIQLDVNILIEEFAAQSFSTSGRNYHFAADLELVNDILVSKWSGTIMDTTYFNRGYYWFHTPVKTVPSFTFTFKTSAVSAPFDNLLPIPILTAQVYFIPGIQTLIYLPYSPPYFTTNHFYFANFSTKTPVQDKNIIDAFNSYLGYDLTPYPNFNSGQQIAINLDTSKLTDIHQYMYYTDQVWDTVTPAIVAKGLWNSTFVIKYSNPVRIQTPAPHGLASGDTVHITDFITWCNGTHYGSAAFDASINSLLGHIVTVIDANTFSIPIDGTVTSYKDIVQYLYAVSPPAVPPYPFQNDPPVIPLDYKFLLYLSTATLSNITINPVIQLEVITMKE